MLTDHQKRQIEATASEQIRQELHTRRNHFDAQRNHHINHLTDHLRTSIIDEYWFDQSASQRLDELSKLARDYPEEKDLDLSYDLDFDR